MEKMHVKFMGYQGPNSVHTAGARTFGEALVDAVGRDVTFELEESILKLGLPAGNLATMVEAGELDFCYTSTMRCAKAVPELGIFELPFVVESREALYRALDGELGAMFQARVEAETPFKILGFWDNGFRHVTNSVRPIHTPEDCEGLTIRTQKSDLHGETFRAFGFKPTGTDIKEYVDTVATDRFHAQDNPLTNTYNFGVHKHHRYVTVSGHFFGITIHICSKDKFNSWPGWFQDAVLEAAAKATAHQRGLAGQEDEMILSKLDPEENEVTILDAEERAAFKKKVEPLLETYRTKFGPEMFELLEN